MLDDTILSLGVPALLRHAAEAHERETGMLKQELNALRRLLGEAAAACVADIGLEAPSASLTSSASGSWKVPTGFESEHGASSSGKDQPGPWLTKKESKRSSAVVSRSPSVPSVKEGDESVEVVVEAKAVDDGKQGQDASSLKEIAKLTDQIKKLEGIQEDQAARQNEEFGIIKMRQLMQQAELERARSETESAAGTRRNSPTPSVISRASKKTDSGWTPLASTDPKGANVIRRSSGNSSFGTLAPSPPLVTCSPSLHGAGTDAAAARLAMMSYEEAFHPTPLVDSRSEGCLPDGQGYQSARLFSFGMSPGGRMNSLLGSSPGGGMTLGFQSCPRTPLEGCSPTVQGPGTSAALVGRLGRLS